MSFMIGYHNNNFLDNSEVLYLTDKNRIELKDKFHSQTGRKKAC